MNQPVIEFSNFSFTYHNADSESLTGIDLIIRKGEFILLTGHSGCGKTTLTRCINGLIPDFFEGDLSGKCRVCGMDIAEHETGEFSPLVGSVFQDPRSQFFTLHVKTEIPFPSENLGTPMDKMQEQYEKAVDVLQIQGLLGKSIFDLSSGEKQKVAIASIYMVGVGIYVLDEPSANLDSEGTEQLRQVLKSLKEQGNTIIISEHKLYYLNGLTDRVLIMKDGKIDKEMEGRVFDRQTAEWFTRHGLRKSDLALITPKSYHPVKGDVSIQIKNLSFGYPGKPLLWHDVTFSAHGGEIIGIIGKNGAGKSTLIRTLMGLEKPKTGKISINGSYSGKQQRRKKSFYVMQDVDYQLFAPNVLEEMLMGMVEALSKRAAEVHAGVVNPKEDNMLKITSDGRKLGLDQRILNPLLPDDEHSKVNQCVENILRIWREGESGKLTQLVFSDLSTPGGEGFTVYEDIRRKLIAAGVPEGEIAFIHDANTEVKKKELFAKVRAGQVRVLMGSTQKMGAGTNVQDRLAALHDLDCPWRPGDLEQRKGRIVRQGNRNDTVHIYRYVTENTFDAYLWQTIENKQKFISQIMTSKSPVRSCEDVDETALSYAEIKALCAGNPLIKEKMDLDIEVARLRLLKANHQSQRFQMEDRLLKYFPVEVEKCRAQVGGFEADLETRNSHPLPSEGFVGMEVLGHTFSDKEEAGKAILEAVKTVVDMKSVRIGHYRGFEMSLELGAFGREYILTLRGRMAHFTTLGSDPRGNIQRIDNTLGSMESRLKTVQDQIATLQKEQEAAKEEIAKPFAQEDELREKSARLIELDTLLDIGKGSPEVMPEGGEPEAMEAAVPDTAQGTREPERKERSREEVR